MWCIGVLLCGSVITKLQILPSRMRNGAKTCLVLSLSMLMLLSTSVSAQNDNSDASCPDNCTCNSLGTQINCSGIMIDTTDADRTTINCDGSKLDCSTLSNFPNIADVEKIYNLDLKSCVVNSSLQCVLPGLNATGVLLLTLQDPLMPLDKEILQGLRALKSVTVFDYGSTKLCNDTDVLPQGTFQDTPLLVSLYVSKYCNELRLDEGVISSLAHLEWIYVTKVWKLALGSRALSHLPSLMDVILTECHISELPENVFDGTNAISSLDLSGNELMYLPERVFHNLRKLEQLKLSNNKLEKVTQELFKSLTKIMKIYLDGNRIMTLPDFLFPSKNVQELSFARNRIENVTADTFGLVTTNMRNLDLSHNRISWNCRNQTHDRIGKSVLANLNTIGKLDLSHNRIQSMCDDWKRVSDYLDLSHNRLEYLTKDDLAFSSDNVRVKFNNNNISTVFPRDTPTVYVTAVFSLGSNPFNCDCRLYRLLRSLDYHYDLKDAQCSQPPSLINVSVLELTDPIRLHSLTCSLDGSKTCGCRLGKKQIIECSCEDTRNLTLPESNFDDIRVMKLKLLRSQLDLTELPSFVTELDLSGLELEFIPDIPNTVRELDLRNNSLQVIPPEIYNKSYKLLLENNPLQCDCSGIDNIINLKKYRLKITDFDSILCYDGARVLERDPDHICDIFEATVISVTCIVALLFLFIAIVLLYKYLPEVQVMLFHIGLQRIVKEEWIDKGKTYDVFLSYTVKDELFVRHILMPKLEEMKYKVCEHTRDWEIGQQISEQIYTSVAHSKKTLFVLSENFMKSEWVFEEFNATILQGNKDRRNRAVVILLEDINLDNAPEIIKSHLTLKTYIKWDATDKSFWRKLQNALPKKLTAEEIRKRQRAVKAVKSLGAGSSLVLNEDGTLMNSAPLQCTTTCNAAPEIIELDSIRQNS